MFKRLLTVTTHKIYQLPVLVLMPHSRCNCRCVMCDIWKANQNKQEISVDDLEKHLPAFKKLNVRQVVLSGGEALMHSNLWKFCDLLHSIGVKISLLSTGVTLAHHATNVVAHCDDVIVSLDGGKETHNRIRNIPGAFEKLEQGVRALKEIRQEFRVTGRSVLQKQNFRALPAIIETAKALGLNQISFLGADISSEAFNRADPWQPERVSEIALDDKEIMEFEAVLKNSFITFKEEYNTRFIAESPDRMKAICQHYKGIAGFGGFPKKKCNAPWVSAVIESDGSMRPCFFHKPYGNIHEHGFAELMNSQKAIDFRRSLDVENDAVCKRCVCSLRLGLTQMN